MLANRIPEPERRRYRAAGLWRDVVLTDALDAHRRERPDKVAVIAYRLGKAEPTRLTFAELADRVDRLAFGLRELGVQRGEVVSFQLPNWWEFAALYCALVRLGAVANPFMPIFRAHDAAQILGATRPRVVVIPGTFRRFDHQAMLADLLPGLDGLRHVFVCAPAADIRPPFRAFDDWLAAPPADPAGWARPDPDDVTELLFTSGTTGHPKGVLHSHNTLLAPVFASAARLRMTADDVILMASPFAHQTGFDYGMVQGILLGTTTVYLDQWDAAWAWELLSRHRVTYTMGATPFLADVVHQAVQRGETLPDLRYFVSAGAPIPRAIVEEASRRLPATRILAGWGMTENGLVTMNGPDDPPEKVYTSDGSVQPGMEIAVFDADGRRLPAEQEGFLKARGAQNFVGYLDDGADARGGFEADEWFQTWDLATIDASGYLRITGRAKDVINRGGEKVPVAEVEGLVYRHPKVRDAALVAMPHPRLGETGCLYVVARDGEPLTLEEVVGHLKAAGLTPQFFPERLELRDALPRTASGKIQKFVLREEVARLVSGL